MKKLLFGALAFFGLAVGSLTTVHAQSWNNQFYWNQATSDGSSGFGVATDAGDLGVAGAGNDTNLVDGIKGFVNWVLGLLSFIALCVLLYGGFQMITAAGDEAKYNAGLTILKQAAIGLIFVGLSWMIVTFIFSIIGVVTTSGNANT